MECIAATQDEATTENSPSGDGLRRHNLLQALKRLGPLQVRILALVLQDGLSLAEVAAHVGIPERAVRREYAEALGIIRWIMWNI